jgi:two-component sensor histidine kinase
MALYFRSLEENLLRIQTIVSGLRYLSRDESHEPMSEVAISELLEVTIGLHREIYAKQGVKIDLSVENAVNNVVISGHFGELQQVLMNMLNNARDAVLGSALKVIMISAQMSKQKGIILKIRDTGCGIPEERLEGIFDSFYSTKKHRVRAGLGLGIVRRIVQDHKGSIEVQSKVDVGSTFSIHLPLVEKIIPAGLRESNTPKVVGKAEEALWQQEDLRAVVVDDEPMLLQVVSSYLESMDIGVFATSSTDQALDALKTGKYQLLLSDMCMPDCDGLSLIYSSQCVAPNTLNCIIMTGGLT